MLEDTSPDLPQEPVPEPPRRSGSRSFLVTAGLLGAIMVVALIGMAIYALVILPQQQAAAPASLSSAQLTGTALAHALQATNTSTNTPTRTPTNTFTPRPPTATGTPITPLFTNAAPAGTQTVNALLTQAALAQTQAAGTAGPSATPGSVTPTATASALPQSGFGDSTGAPLLLAVAGVLLLVIVAARRLRNTV